MRLNLPVTAQEYVLDDLETIVSKTDLQGNITYVNQAFIRISGFSAEELLGAPQNIIRHPDMPPAAFADMWRALQAGRAWSGLVKNRCKNGAFYWVEANAAPLIERGQVVGYTSIRVKPPREKVEAAERAYALLRQPDSGLTVRMGQVVPARHSWFARMAPRTLRSASFALMAVQTIVCGASLALNLAHGWAFGAVLAALGLLLAPCYLLLLHRKVIAPIEQLRSDMANMSCGNLSRPVAAKASGEIGSLVEGLKVLQTNIKLLVGQIQESSEVLAGGASDIAHGSEDLSARIDSQASALQETAATMAQLTGTVKQNCSSALRADQLMDQSVQQVAAGTEAVGRVIDTMRGIQASSGKISEITSVIDSLAFQTNILALNAAVEAARAGEQGRGFAVVASEVRTLAQRSATAAKEIRTLIVDSVERVDTGSKVVDEAGATMAEILASISQVQQLVQQISAASTEQASGIENVSRAVNNIDELTQQNSIIVDEAAKAARGMDRQSSHLSQLVGSFTLSPTLH